MKGSFGDVPITWVEKTSMQVESGVTDASESHDCVHISTDRFLNEELHLSYFKLIVIFQWNHGTYMPKTRFISEYLLPPFILVAAGHLLSGMIISVTTVGL